MHAVPLYRWSTLSYQAYLDQGYSTTCHILLVMLYTIQRWNGNDKHEPPELYGIDGRRADKRKRYQARGQQDASGSAIPLAHGQEQPQENPEYQSKADISIQQANLNYKRMRILLHECGAINDITVILRLKTAKPSVTDLVQVFKIADGSHVNRSIRYTLPQEELTADSEN